MNFKKSILALSLALAITTSAAALPAYAASSFKDVPDGDPYSTFVEHLKQNQITEGIGDGLFGPDETLTRAEFATFIVRAFGIPTDNVSAPFADIKDHWASTYIKAAFTAKVIEGTSPTTFEPASPVKREEAAVMIWRYLKAQGMEAKVAQLEDNPDNWAVEAVQNICGHALHGPEVQYFKGARYRPQDSMLRKEMAALLDKSIVELATLKEAKDKGITIVNDHLGTPNEPVIPVIGTVIKFHWQNELFRTTTVSDVLNPDKDGFTKRNADGTITIENVPIISVKAENSEPKNVDFVKNVIPKFSVAAKLIAQLKIEVNADGDVTIPVPQTDGMTWKYHVNGSYGIVTDGKLNVKYAEGARFRLILDLGNSPDHPNQPAAMITFVQKGKTLTVFSISTLDIN